MLKDYLHDGNNRNFELSACKAMRLLINGGQEHSVSQPTETFNNFQALFELNWELDIWGHIKDATTASAYNAEAVGNDYSAARLSLAARTAQAYFFLSEANLQRLQAADHRLASARKALLSRVTLTASGGTRTALL